MAAKLAYRGSEPTKFKKAKIKKDDEVLVISGKEKGKKGKSSSYRQTQRPRLYRRCEQKKEIRKTNPREPSRWSDRNRIPNPYLQCDVSRHQSREQGEAKEEN